MAATVDSIVMTGHQGPEVSAGELLVTPTGGTQRKLADALAAAPATQTPTYNTLVLTAVPAALTDLLAKTAGVPIGGLYRSGNVLMIRLV